MLAVGASTGAANLLPEFPPPPQAVNHSPASTSIPAAGPPIRFFLARVAPPKGMFIPHTERQRARVMTALGSTISRVEIYPSVKRDVRSSCIPSTTAPFAHPRGYQFSRPAESEFLALRPCRLRRRRYASSSRNPFLGMTPAVDLRCSIRAKRALAPLFSRTLPLFHSS
jgi:hypothetical protein